MDFHERLRRARERKGLTGKVVSEKLSISAATYSGYEHARTEPNLDILVRICQLLDVSADYLIGISEDPDSRVVRIQSSMPSITARLNRELDPLADLTTIERQLVLDYAKKLIAARPRPVEGPETSEGVS